MAGTVTAAIPRRKTAPERAETPEAVPRLAQLIAAAEDIFIAKGYHAATMSDVAKAAGMSKKTVYTMIESKAELFDALLAHHQSLIRFPEPVAGWTVREILVANLLCLAQFLLSPGQIAIVRLIMAEYTHSPDLGRVFHHSRVIKAKSQLERCLGGVVIRAGARNIPPKDMAAMLFGMAFGEFHMSTLIGYRAAPGKVVLERRIRHAVDIFLAGCGITV